MTVIVATARFIAADRRVTDGDSISSMVKVAKNLWLIAAASGDAASTLAVKRAVRRGATTPEDLLAHVNKDSYALVLTHAGVLARLQGGVVWPHSGLDAIGSGGEMALGYLGGAGGDVTQELVRAALRFVFRRRADCGGGVDVRTFG